MTTRTTWWRCECGNEDHEIEVDLNRDMVTRKVLYCAERPVCQCGSVITEDEVGRAVDRAIESDPEPEYDDGDV